MGKRWATTLWTRAARRQMATLTRSALRVGSKLAKKALKAPSKRALKAVAPSALPNLTAGLAGTRRYQLYKSPTSTKTRTSTRAAQPSPEPALVVMLHGCGQDARSFAASTRMNRLAHTHGFMVLYPEQERVANAQGCWNWFATRSGKAQREAASILMAVNQVCALHDVDRRRVAGMSAGGQHGRTAGAELSAQLCGSGHALRRGARAGQLYCNRTGRQALGGHGGCHRKPTAHGVGVRTTGVFRSNRAPCKC